MKVNFCQVNFLSCSALGTISDLSTTNCNGKIYSGFPIFLDIAITPNKTLYGINGVLSKIDYSNNTVINIGTIMDSNNRYITGTGLVAIDNNYLFTDFKDSLFKIDASTAIALPIGNMGYYCAGDFAFYNDTLYLVSTGNHLIQICLNPSKTTILYVKDIGLMNTDGLSVLSLFTSYECKTDNIELFAIEGYKVYKINTKNANAVFVCSLPDTLDVSYGATSIYDFNSKNSTSNKIPNVFTPNNDGINDYFNLSEINIGSEFKIIIYNRWGQIVFESDDINLSWNGKNKFGQNLIDGTYYFVINYFNQCNEKENKNGFITLLK